MVSCSCWPPWSFNSLSLIEGKSKRNWPCPTGDPLALKGLAGSAVQSTSHYSCLHRPFVEAGSQRGLIGADHHLFQFHVSTLGECHSLFPVHVCIFPWNIVHKSGSSNDFHFCVSTFWGTLPTDRTMKTAKHAWNGKRLPFWTGTAVFR